MKQIVFDANPFLRLFLNDIPSQSNKAQKLLEQAKKRKIIVHVSQITIFELGFALGKYYHFPKEKVINRITTVIEAAYLQVQDRSLFRATLKLYEGNAVSLADSFVLSYALEKGAKLFTFDKKLKKLT